MTELGDETFIIAAIMAMRHPRLVVYAGAMSALGFMTVRAPAPDLRCPKGPNHPPCLDKRVRQGGDESYDAPDRS